MKIWTSEHIFKLLLYLHMALFGRLDSASLHSVSSFVGNQVVLPCNWRSRFGSRSFVYLKWFSDSLGAVLEQSGYWRWVCPELKDRAEVLESGLEFGDCSLIIRDVHVTDAGLYYSYMVQDEDPDMSKTKNWTYIESVKLLVYDRISVESKRPGEDLVLDLPSPRSMSLVFRNSSRKWVPLWHRGTNATGRLQKDPLREQLTLKNLTPFDQGIYKVLDANRLTMGTTRLILDQHESTTLRFTQFEENLVPRDPPTMPSNITAPTTSSSLEDDKGHVFLGSPLQANPVSGGGSVVEGAVGGALFLLLVLSL